MVKIRSLDELRTVNRMIPPDMDFPVKPSKPEMIMPLEKIRKAIGRNGTRIEVEFLSSLVEDFTTVQVILGYSGGLVEGKLIVHQNQEIDGAGDSHFGHDVDIELEALVKVVKVVHSNPKE